MVKDWYTYIDEHDKVKAWDVTKEDGAEVEGLLNEVGFRVVGKCAFTRELDAINYTKQVLL